MYYCWIPRHSFSWPISGQKFTSALSWHLPLLILRKLPCWLPSLLLTSSTSPACCCISPPWHKAMCSWVADWDRELVQAQSEVGEGTKCSLHCCMRNVSTRMKAVNYQDQAEAAGEGCSARLVLWAPVPAPGIVVWDYPALASDTQHPSPSLHWEIFKCWEEQARHSPNHINVCLKHFLNLLQILIKLQENCNLHPTEFSFEHWKQVYLL